MDVVKSLFQEHAERIATSVTAVLDIEEFAPLLRGLVDELAARCEEGTALDPAPLREALMDDAMIARVLRTLFFETVELLREKLDAPESNEAVLRLRACMRPAIPQLPPNHEDEAFYQRLLGCECDGLTAEHRRLVHLFEDLVLAFPDIVYVHDLNGRLLYINMPGLKLTQFTRQDLIDGLSVFDLIAPEFNEVVESRIVSAGAVSRAPYTVEIYTKTGERIPFELTTRCIKREGRIVGVVGLAHDLRLARRLENEIHRSNTYIEAIVTHAPLGIVLCDRQCMILDANPMAVTMFGAQSPSDLIGNPLYGLLEGECAPLRDAMMDAIEDELEARVKCTEPTAFKAALNCDIRVVPLKRDMGCVDSLLILMADLTSQFQLQQNLVQSEKLSAIGEIVAGVAHELNNPLTGILGYAQLLMSSKVEPTIHTRLEHITMEAERCRRIVQNLLSFARHYESEKAVRCVNDILSDTLALREYQIRIDGIELELDFDPNVPNIVADAHELQRVFLNLVNNAQQALASVENRTKRLAIRTSFADGFVQIVFEDNGPGVPAAIQSKVFDPFFTTKGVGEGTGLGLSVSYGVIRDHGGRISLSSKEGEGAIFTILLPAVSDSE